MTFEKHIIAAAMIGLLSGQVHAIPREAIHSFLTNLFKGGASKEAVVAGRAADVAATAKASEHIGAGDAAGVGNALPAVEPKPDLAAEVIAKSIGDANSYKSLRIAADRGDTSAMLKMSELTASGRVSDPGEPWRGYWMFQAARLGSKAAARKTLDECDSGESRRAIDRWFDSACRSADGRSLYPGGRLPVVSSQNMQPPTNSHGHAESKQ